MVKPGYRTSEFWFTLVSFIFSGLFLLGIIGDNEQKEELIRSVSHGVESIILIGGQVLILWNYINSRAEAKARTIPQPIPTPIETPSDPQSAPSIPKTKTVKSKKNTKKTTKKKKTKK